MSLEQRVKALEDLMQRLAQAFLAAPNQPQPQTPSKFTQETVDHITIQLNGDIVTKEFIHDKALWARINEDLKKDGYKWVSAGKDSRWSKQ